MGDSSLKNVVTVYTGGRWTPEQALLSMLEEVEEFESVIIVAKLKSYDVSGPRRTYRKTMGADPTGITAADICMMGSIVQRAAFEELGGE